MVWCSRSHPIPASEDSRLARFLALHALQQAAGRDHANDIAVLDDRDQRIRRTEIDSDDGFRLARSGRSFGQIVMGMIVSQFLRPP